MLVGTIVNTMAVLVGSMLGLQFGKLIPARVDQAVMKALGLCTVFVGIVGVLKPGNMLVVIVSIVVGALVGELADLDGLVQNSASRLEKRFRRSNAGPSWTQGFVSATMLFCVGAMTIIGALQDGLRQDHTILFAKSLMDFCSSTVLAATLGFGVTLAAIAVFVIQGSLALAAAWLSPVLTEVIINEIAVVGSILILGLGFDLLGVVKLKIINYVPAVILPVPIYWLISIWNG